MKFRTLAALAAVGTLAGGGVMFSATRHASAATLTQINTVTADRAPLLTNVADKTDVVVQAAAGSFTPGDTVTVIECNVDPANGTTGAGCNINNVVPATVNADGSVTAVPFTVNMKGLLNASTPTSSCPPSATQVKNGYFCAIIMADQATNTVGAVPLFPKPALAVVNNANGTLTATCKGLGNTNTNPLGGGTVQQQHVVFTDNGTTVAVLNNVTGTVKATFTGATGDSIRCYTIELNQISKVVTSP